MIGEQLTLNVPTLGCALSTTLLQADYAEERLDAHHEFQEELDEALRIRKMVETGLHDTALERLMASTEVRKTPPRPQSNRPDTQKLFIFMLQHQMAHPLYMKYRGVHCLSQKLMIF